MGQKQALANVLLLWSPFAIGLLASIYSVGATFHPIEFRLVILALYTSGLALFLCAKVSLVRQGIPFSIGSAMMSRWNRRAYGAGYALMAIALVGTFVLLNVTVIPPGSEPLRQSSSHRLER